ncbi:hypothetical protein DYB30_008653 [Aphanomyces astaci]|uniref:Uncharacterized protein n=1 Tax=Aphanomyces astaci TaxID=112090 RepID=A0A397DZ60_APHAT|nr:hypothetical protein DYB30_008653 [Aphanomyces astaci]
MTAVPAVTTTALTAHPIYETYAELLGDAVVVSLHSLAFLRGALFGIDPENGNVILFEWLPDENDKAVRTHTVMAHAIASIERDTDESSTDVSAIRLRLAATMQLSHASQTLESLRQHLQQCARLAATGQLQATPEDMKKQFYVKSIGDFCGPGLLVLRKYDDDNIDIATLRQEPTPRRTSWLRSIEQRDYHPTTTDVMPHTNGSCGAITADAFVTPMKPRSSFVTSTDQTSHTNQQQQQQRHAVQTSSSSTVVTTSCTMRVVATCPEETHVDSFQSPIHAIMTPASTRRRSSIPQPYTTPAPTSRHLRSSRLLHVQLPESTPLPLGLPDTFGISPVIADNKKKAATAMQLKKKRHFDVAASSAPIALDEDEVDIVLRHDDPVEQAPSSRRPWTTPDFLFKRFRSSCELEPIEACPTQTTATPLDDKRPPPPSTSLWDRFKSIRMPEVLAEGLALHVTSPLDNHDDDLYDDHNDDLCYGFDLMDVDHADDSDDGNDMTIPDDQDISKQPLTLEFTLTPMTAVCHHSTHERRSSSRLAVAKTTPSLPAAPPVRRRTTTTRSQRKKRLALGVSLSNVAQCQEIPRLELNLLLWTGVFPIPGLTTIPVVIVVFLLGLNPVAAMLTNYLVTPLNIASVPVFVYVDARYVHVEANASCRAYGNQYFGDSKEEFSVNALFTGLQEDLVGTLSQFRFILLNAIYMWAAFLLIATPLLYAVLFPVLKFSMGTKPAAAPSKKTE